MEMVSFENVIICLNNYNITNYIRKYIIHNTNNILDNEKLLYYIFF